MDAAEFVYWINQNAARITEYSNGGDGSNGKSDCIGLIIGAWRLSGNKWPWTHGSNYTARYLTDKLGYDQDLHLGDLVYKARKPGESGYSLPDRYMDSGDLLDYYHVGVVTQEDPLQITHCTSVPGGIKRDSKRGAWHYSGMFSKLENGGGQVIGKAYVTGGKLNLRNSYSRAAKVIAQIPNGSEVEIIEVVNDDWDKVTWNGLTGYCMSKYLTDEPDTDVMPLEERVELAKELLEKALDLLGRG